MAAKPFIATTKLFVGTALAYNPGDAILDETAVERHGWQDGVAREGSKTADEAQKKASEPSGPATGISDQLP